jgi:predicted RNase H-related nuclease YkuK (DUF458 family)
MSWFRDEFIEQIKQFAESRQEYELTEFGDLTTRLYIGADSRRRLIGHKTWKVSYTTCAVFHLGGRNGCKVFADVSTEIDRSGSLRLRLMNEVYRAVDLYRHISPLWMGDTEIHLDLNPDSAFKSNTVLAEARGYVLGMTNIDPKIKPDAWAASTASDLYEIKVPHVPHVFSE